MSIIGDAFLAIRPDADGFDKELQGSLGKAGKNIAKVGAAVGAAAVAGAAVSIKAFGDFDQAMTNSTAIMGDVSDAMRGDMADAAREVAKTTAFSANEAAESFYFLASAGMDAEQSMAALPQVAAFAQAGNFDMARATDIATDAQSALGLASDDAAENLGSLTRVTDVFVKAATLANTSVEQIGEAMTEKAGSAMKSLNMDVEEGSAVLAAFADVGIKGSQAGTTFAATMEGLTRGARENAAEFDRLGVSVFDADGNLNNMADIVTDLEGSLGGLSVEQQRAELAALGFNRQSMNGIQALMGNSDALREYEEELRNAGGTTDDVAGKQMETFWAQLGLLKDQLMDVALTVGEQLMPHMMRLVEVLQDNMPAIEAFIKNGVEVLGTIIRTVVVPAIQTLVGYVRRLIDWWNNLSPATQNVITTVGKVVAGLVLLAPIIAKVIAAVKVGIVIFKALAAVVALVVSPLGLLVAAVAAIAFAVYYYWDEIVAATTAAWDWITGKLGEAWDWIVDVATRAGEWLSDVWTRITDAASAAAAWFTEHVGPVFEAFGALVRAVFDRLVGPIIEAWQMIREAWETHGATILETISNAWTVFRVLVAAVWDAIVERVMEAWETIVAVWDAVGEPLLGVLSAAWESVRDVIATVWEQIVDNVETALAVVAGIIDVVTAAISGDWSAVWEGIRNVLRTIWDAMTRQVERANDLVERIVGRMLDAVQRLWDRAWEAVKGVLSDAWTSITSTVREKLADVVTFFRELPGRIVSAIPNPLNMLRNVGRDIIQGLINGVTGMAGKARTAIGDVGRGMRDRLTGFFSMSSPSKLTEQHGRWIVEGLAEGIAKAADLPVSATESLARRVANVRPTITPATGTAALTSSQGAAGQARNIATAQQPLVGVVNIYSTDPKRSGDAMIRSLRERAYLSAPLGRQTVGR